MSSFSILIGSSGGSRTAAMDTPAPVESSFSILIGSSGGSRVRPLLLRCKSRAVSVSSSDRRGVQVGRHSVKPIPIFIVSVSSSDRRGVQEQDIPSMLVYVAMFQYPHRIVGGFKENMETREKMKQSSFSILIGSSGGSSKNLDHLMEKQFGFQYPHRIVGGFKLPRARHTHSDRSRFSILIGSSGGSSHSFKHKILYPATFCCFSWLLSLPVDILTCGAWTQASPGVFRAGVA